MGSIGASYAEFAVTDWGRLAPLPDANMSWEIAATLPIALQTMHDAVVTHGQCGPGSAIMIQGASSGVGLMGLQVARLMGADDVVGTPTNPEQAGAPRRVSARRSLWTPTSPAGCGRCWTRRRRGVDAVVDMISGSWSRKRWPATADLGRIVNVGGSAARKAEFDFDLHAARTYQL
jgi:NADPH2:quinone reductase